LNSLEKKNEKAENWKRKRENRKSVRIVFHFRFPVFGFLFPVSSLFGSGSAELGRDGSKCAGDVADFRHRVAMARPRPLAGGESHGRGEHGLRPEKPRSAQRSISG
jgi:hypothetical protein